MRYWFIVTALTTSLSSRNGAVRQRIYASSANSILIADVNCARFSLRNYVNKPYTFNDARTKNHSKELQKKKHVVVPKLYNYLNTVMPEALNICPKSILKTRVKKCKQLYIVDATTAKEIVSLIIDDLSKNMCFVAEINPGLGLITRALLEAGVPFVYMYETSFSFHNRLRSLSKEFPNRTELRCTNLLQIDKILFIDESYQKKADKALKDIPSNKWENDTCIQLVCTLGNVSSIRNIILTTIYQSSYTKYGRPVFYAIIKPEVWNLYTNEKKRKWNVESAMFHILFDYKEYGKVSRKSFLPWEYIDPKKDKSDELCVVKIEAKANLFSKHKNKDEIMNIWHFMKYCYGVRNSRFIIPEFEKMIPGCGIKLIARNYNIFTQFQDLSIEELHEIFEEFKSEPAFIQNLEPTSLVLHNEK